VTAALYRVLIHSSASRSKMPRALVIHLSKNCTRDALLADVYCITIRIQESRLSGVLDDKNACQRAL